MFDSGTLFVCNLTNTAENGDMPRYELERVNKYWFENRYIGYNRSYTAMGVNERIDMLVRIPRDETVRIGQYVELGNGDQYRISLISHGLDVNPRTKSVDSKYYRTPTLVGLKYTELTLVRLDTNYDVAISED